MSGQTRLVLKKEGKERKKADGFKLLNEHYRERNRDEKANESNQRRLPFSLNSVNGRGRAFEMSRQPTSGALGPDGSISTQHLLLTHTVPQLCCTSTGLSVKWDDDTVCVVGVLWG